MFLRDTAAVLGRCAEEVLGKDTEEELQRSSEGQRKDPHRTAPSLPWRGWTEDNKKLSLSVYEKGKIGCLT